MNPVVMRRADGLLVLTVLLDFTNYVWTLPPPSCVSMDSVNMHHVLRWRPLQAPCDAAVLYSVQFQGEFELLLLNGSWLDAPDCQHTPHTHCDLTFDLGSDSDYNVHVRGRCGAELSAWTGLSRPFNRRDTVLVPPEVTVAAASDGLQVSFANLPLTAAVSVSVWKRGDEQQAAVFSVPADQRTLHVAALQEGAVYCVRAQTVLDSRLHSSSTDAQCVSIAGPDGAWKKPTTVTVTVIVMAGLLFAVFWSAVHWPADACRAYFRKEPLPHSLKPDWDVQIPMSPEEDLLCERIHVVTESHSSPGAPTSS